MPLPALPFKPSGVALTAMSFLIWALITFYTLQARVDAGFASINTRLDAISEQSKDHWSRAESERAYQEFKAADNEQMSRIEHMERQIAASTRKGGLWSP